jgi:hypothetical protein
MQFSLFQRRNQWIRVMHMGALTDGVLEKSKNQSKRTYLHQRSFAGSSQNFKNWELAVISF